jgi:hypothetical protein
MKKKGRKEDNTSVEKSKKQSAKKNRLAGMLESMENRSDPVSTHKIATEYFKTFRVERELPPDPLPKYDSREPGEEDKPTAVVNALGTKVPTPVDQSLNKYEKEKQYTKLKYLDSTYNSSEAKVYSVMYKECMKHNTKQRRFGSKELKEKTGLSDKTIRVAIHALEGKMSIKIIEPSFGIYGRKFYVFSPEEILVLRKKAKINIDPTTKRIVIEKTVR